jgi:hypothetical protein
MKTIISFPGNTKTYIDFAVWKRDHGKLLKQVSPSFDC